MLATSLAESLHTIRMIQREDLHNKRILEVGAGLGITSCFLARWAVNNVSLEPGGIGFERYRRLAELIREALGVAHEHLTISAEELSPAEHGKVDLIFSNNVMEHVESVDVCLERLHSVLASGGRMIHNCPNYLVPYEPHYGLPLIPFYPETMARLLPKSITEQGLWKSLNFITLPQVAMIGKRLGATVEFQFGMMYQALVRLGDDAEFRARHRVLARLYPVLRTTGLRASLRFLPARFCTPMVFTWTRGG